jgi:predicted transcriptional regulator
MKLGGGKMSTVTLDIRSLDDTLQDFAVALKEGKPSDSRISFESVELLWKVLTAKRWGILKIMAGVGPLAIREVARRVERDVKAVHGDIHVLLKAGIIEKTDKGVIFPYDVIHVNFMLIAA